MTRTIDIVENVPATARPRSVWKPLAAAGIGGAVLVATGFGVFAQLQAQADNVLTPQAVNTGDLKLELGRQTTAGTGGALSAGFTQPINNLAPGDNVNRFVTLTNTGSLDGALLKLKVADTTVPASLLSTDPVHGLRVTVQSCPVAWTAPLASPNPLIGAPTAGTGPTCTGTLNGTAVAASTALSAPLSGFGAPLDLAGVTTAKSVNNLLVTVGLPDQFELSVNGGTPSPFASNGVTAAASSIQKLAASLVFTFTEDQRAAVTSNS